jgi:hypothetical protein
LIEPDELLSDCRQVGRNDDRGVPKVTIQDGSSLVTTNDGAPAVISAEHVVDDTHYFHATKLTELNKFVESPNQ